MAKFLSFLRFIFITVLWSLFYFGLARKYFMSVDGFAGFDILRKSHWLNIYDQWIDGWIITSGVEHLFFFSVIFLLPIWALVLWGLVAFDYTGFVKGKIAARRKRIAKMKAEEALYNPPKIPVYRDPEKYRRRPVPLRALSGTQFNDKPKAKGQKGEDDKRSVANKTEKTQPAEASSVSAAAGASASDKGRHDVDSEDDVLSEDDILSGKALGADNDLPDFNTSGPDDDSKSVIEGDSVEEILTNAGYRLLKNLTVEEEQIDFLAVSDDKLLVVKCFNDDGQWLADEVPFRDEDPQWFSEVSQRTSPVKNVTNMAEFFDDKVDEKYDIIPVLVISKANIMNAEEITKSWEDLHVTVAVIDDGGPKNILPSVGAAVLPAGTAASDSDFEKIKAIFNR